MGDSAIESSSDPYGEEAIDFRSHVLVLAANWRKIALGAVLTAGVAGALMWALWSFMPKYEASADVAIIRSAPKVSIDETLRTVTTNRTSHRDRIAQRAAFVGLVHNGDVARSVVGRLGNQLEEDQNETTLLDDVTSDLVTMGVHSEANTSDLIRITASADSPGKAMDFANAWAEEYVKVVNRIYEKAPASLLAAINAELANTRRKFSAAQESLEILIAASRSSELERKISLRSSLVDNWTKAQSEALNTNYTNLNRMNSLLTAARVLRAQMESAGETNTASNELGILLLKAEAYTVGVHTVQIELGNVFEKAGVMHADSVDRFGDVDALIASLEKEIGRLQTNIMSQYRYSYLFQERGNEEAAGISVDEISEPRVPGGNSHSKVASRLDSERRFHGQDSDSLSEIVIEIENEIRLMQEEKEKEDRLLLDATKNRDLLRSSLDSLENEIVELTLVKASEVSTEVRLASPAVLPKDPAGPHPILVAAVGGFAGLLAMVCFVLLMRPAAGQPLFPR